MTDAPVGDWTPALFESNGRELLAMLREHFDTIRQTPVAATVDPAELLRRLDDALPESGEDFARILADTRQRVVPDLVQWNHPAFFGYFPSCASFPGVLAETLGAALNVNAMLWRTSPAASALESVVMRWLADLVGYPADADGLLLNGASLATLYVLAAARAAALPVDVRRLGAAGPGMPVLRVYASDQAHSSVERAAITLGIGLDNVVRIPTDDRYRIRPDLLDRAIGADRAAGRCPVAVVATVGTTAVGAADPLGPVAEICHRHGVWLHVDAAYGGFWNAAPRLAGRLEDLSVGDSLVANPQKTLFVPLEATALFCRRPGVLADTFRLVPEYLRSPDADVTVDYMDLSPQLGRSFRALKVWWVLRAFGRTGIAARLDHAVALAARLRTAVDRHPDWRALPPSPYPLLCLRYEPATLLSDPALTGERRRELLDTVNAATLDAVNRSGRAFVSHAVARDGYVIRVAIGNIHTTAADIDRFWALLTDVAHREFGRLWPAGAVHRSGSDIEQGSPWTAAPSS